MSTVVGTPQYDTAEYVLILTRSIINDAAQSKDGNLLSDAQPYTFPMLNSAYRYLQDELADHGVETFPKEQIIAQLTAVPSSVIDPATQTILAYNGYFDGMVWNASPYLPADMVRPLRVWERQTGTTNQFREVLPVNDGLPSVSQGANLRWYDWRGDQMYFIGATQSNDLKLRYLSYLPDLLDGTSPVAILRGANALAYLTAAQFAAARGSPLADSYRTQADVYIEQITQGTQRKKQRAQHRRRPYGSR